MGLGCRLLRVRRRKFAGEIDGPKYRRAPRASCKIRADHWRIRRWKIHHNGSATAKFKMHPSLRDNFKAKL
jgi:hypothetical protein